MRIKLGHFHTSADITRALSLPPPTRPFSLSHLCTDAREIEPGDLFVALRGERFDGHDFIDDARARGARAVLCEEGRGRDTDICVKNTEKALALLGARARDEINPTVIAVTGSVGKTTTKDMIAATLAAEYPTHKTEGNHNNLLGLSLSLLAMPEDTQYFVAELGMNHAREIAHLSAIARPDVAVITNVGRAHIGQLGSREAIARAKLEILEGCEPGTLYFYPAEEKLLSPPCSAAVIPYPIASRAGADNALFDVYPEDRYTRFSLDFRRWRYDGLRVRGVGAHIAACAAFAVCIGDLFGVSHEGIVDALLSYEEGRGRQNIFTLNGITVIEDSYNASPESMQASIATLSHIAKKNRGRSLALLGEMKELGAESDALHYALGHTCAKEKLAYLFPFGQGAQAIRSGALSGGMTDEQIIINEDVESPEASAKEIAARLRRGDVLLIKASRALRAERVVAALQEILKARGGATP